MRVKCLRNLFAHSLTGLACLLSSCATQQSRFAAQEEHYHQEMLTRYRPGSRWLEPQDRLRGFSVWDLTSPAPGGFAELALAQARTHSGDLRSCRWGWVARQTHGSSFGAMGIFVDYVFLDSEERVVIAFRRFLD